MVLGQYAVLVAALGVVALALTLAVAVFIVVLTGDTEGATRSRAAHHRVHDAVRLEARVDERKTAQSAPLERQRRVSGARD